VFLVRSISFTLPTYGGITYTSTISGEKLTPYSDKRANFLQVTRNAELKATKVVLYAIHQYSTTSQKQMRYFSPGTSTPQSDNGQLLTDLGLESGLTNFKVSFSLILTPSPPSLTLGTYSLFIIKIISLKTYIIRYKATVPTGLGLQPITFKKESFMELSDITHQLLTSRLD
jgi:hypothetical protein